MRTLILGYIIFMAFKTVGQTADLRTKQLEIIYGDRLMTFLDSLKSAIFSDTIRYKPGDVIKNGNFIENKNHYSKLYIVQELKGLNLIHFYSYKMDVVRPRMVIEFVNEYLNKKVIKRIMIDNEPDSILFPNVPGIFWIDLWEKATFNPKIAKLKINKEGNGSNFYDWEKVAIRNY